MQFRPCILIPIYNHGELLLNSIDKILSYQIPILIIDDGSDQKTKKILKEIGKNNDVKIHHLPKNQGKGAALIYGFKEAAKNFSHAVQIDADNQHSTDDIKIFLELAKNNPDALINGCPQYDDSVPLSRLYGRKITNFFVAIETLSLKIKDAMCGFRVYPLKETIPIINSTNIAKRMGFDIEIIVRLYWNNVHIINQRTKVTYPKNGSSHFRMFKDNLIISAIHTKLVTEMIFRILKKLTRKN